MPHSLPTESTPVPLPTARQNPFDPPADLTHFREREPVRRLSYPDGHVGWLVTSHELCRSVLADQRFSHRMDLQRVPVDWPSVANIYGHPVPPGVFINMDPPDHTRYRRLLAGQFTVRRMGLLREHIGQIVDEHLDAMGRAGPPTDLVQTFALPIPSLVICELLGVPYADRADFHRDNTAITSHRATTEEGTAAWQSLTDYFRELIRHKRTHPVDDLLSGLITDSDLTDEELAGVGFLLHRAGHETTANMLALGTFALLQHPEQLARLRADSTPVDNAVEELLRYLTILQFGVTRTALEDVDLDGHLISAGDAVTVSLPAANRDSQKFENPDALDLGRATGGHVAFGHGIHQCIGQQLARIEMRIGYVALLQRFPTLCLAAPAEEIPLRTDMGFYGVHRLPVSW